MMVMVMARDLLFAINLSNLNDTKNINICNKKKKSIIDDDR